MLLNIHYFFKSAPCRSLRNRPIILLSDSIDRKLIRRMQYRSIGSLAGLAGFLPFSSAKNNHGICFPSSRGFLCGGIEKYGSGPRSMLIQPQSLSMNLDMLEVMVKPSHAIKTRDLGQIHEYSSRLTRDMHRSSRLGEKKGNA